MSLKNQLKVLKELSKSGIVTLVLISVFAGYLIGQSSETSLDLAEDDSHTCRNPLFIFRIFRPQSAPRAAH